MYNSILVLSFSTVAIVGVVVVRRYIAVLQLQSVRYYAVGRGSGRDDASLLGRRGAVDAVGGEEPFIARRLQQLHDARQQGLQGDEVLSHGLNAVDRHRRRHSQKPTHSHTTHEDDHTTRYLPGSVAMKVWWRVPATGRAKTAKGVYFKPSCNKACAIPGAGRWSSGEIVSGVKSRGPKPVPPEVNSKSTTPPPSRGDADVALLSGVGNPLPTTDAAVGIGCVCGCGLVHCSTVEVITSGESGTVA